MSGLVGAPPAQQTVGISEMLVRSGGEDVLVTYSLGSCVGVAAYDPVARAGGLIHCMLPLSKIDAAKAAAAPAMFVDTGVPALLNALFEYGAERKRLVVKVAGASSLLDEKGLFKIGERNYTVLRKLLWKNNILIAAEDVGGQVARTMYLHMATGRTVIRSQGQERDL
ncbi:MAG TPA: chemotaxis protein CheD [Planctomycetota bacterium]|nr:chemotaxis protein CheD [Planctomycetota bacterium]